jgi:hypothetical protein
VNDDYVFNQTTPNEQLQEIVKLLENELDPKACDHFDQVNISHYTFNSKSYLF